jgi:hypothetical protein
MVAFSDDTARGAKAIALAIFGKKGKPRSVYGMGEERKRRYGITHDGKTLIARKSRINQVGMLPEEEEGAS